MILKAKKLGFTLPEIGRMTDAQEGRATAHALKLSRNQCREQISLLEGRLQEAGRHSPDCSAFTRCCLAHQAHDARR